MGGGCSDDGLQPNLDVGDEVDFSGCNVKTTVSDNSGLQPEEYTVMTFWNEVWILYQYSLYES